MMPGSFCTRTVFALLFLGVWCAGLDGARAASGSKERRIVVEDFIFFDAPKNREHLKQAIPAALELRFAKEISASTIIAKPDLWKSARSKPIWNKNINDRSRLVFDREIYTDAAIRADFVVDGEIVLKGENEFAILARVSRYMPSFEDYIPIGPQVEVRATLSGLIAKIDDLSAQLVDQINNAQLEAREKGHVFVIPLCFEEKSGQSAFNATELEDYLVLRLNRLPSIEASFLANSGQETDKGGKDQACPDIYKAASSKMSGERNWSFIFVSGKFAQSAYNKSSFDLTLTMTVAGVDSSSVNRKDPTLLQVSGWPTISGGLLQLRSNAVETLMAVLDKALSDDGIWDIHVIRKNLLKLRKTRPTDSIDAFVADVARLNDAGEFTKAIGQLEPIVKPGLGGMPTASANGKGIVETIRDAGLLFEYARAHAETILLGDVGGKERSRYMEIALQALDALDDFFDKDARGREEINTLQGRMYSVWGRFLRGRLSMADDRRIPAMELLEAALTQSEAFQILSDNSTDIASVAKRLPRFKEASLDVHGLLARELRRDKKHEAAGQHFRRLVDLEPDKKVNWTQWITNLVDQGKPEDALAAWRDAIRHPTFADQNAELIYPRRLIAETVVQAATDKKDIKLALNHLKRYRMDVGADIYFIFRTADAFYDAGVYSEEIKDFAANTGKRECQDRSPIVDETDLSATTPYLCAAISYFIQGLELLEEKPQSDYWRAVMEMNLSEALLLTSQWERVRNFSERSVAKYRELKYAEQKKGADSDRGVADFPSHYSRILAYHRLIAELMLDGDISGARRAFEREVQETEYKSNRTWNNSNTQTYLDVALGPVSIENKDKWALIDNASKQVEKN